MEIVENLTQWGDEFEQNWLRHYRETGETLWKIYNRARNETAPGLPGIDLSQSRLLFISTAGGYVADEQQPFAAADLLGDYTVRTFPVDTPLAQLAYAHDHYDHTAVTTDPQVLLPLNHLQEMVAAGEIGSLYREVISFHGYQPDVRRIVNELIPTVLGMVDKGKIDGALLAPAWPLCVQSVGLLARALEMAGVATTLTSWNPVIRLAKPPRATLTRLNRGATLGEPHNVAQQRRVLQATLALLRQDAPLDIVQLDETP